MKYEGKPGTGKSDLLKYWGKPKWMPRWMFRLWNPHNVIDVGRRKLTTVSEGDE